MSQPDPLRYANASRAVQEGLVLQYVLANPVNAEIFRRLPDLPVPQGMLFSGCIYQCVWNGLTGRDPQYGIRDYDLGYYDASDLGYDAEDVVIKACEAAFADLHEEIEVRNQARVHIWFEAHFGHAFEPLSNTSEALTRFMSPTHAVGVMHGPDGELQVHAPFGLNDLFSLQLKARNGGAGIHHDSWNNKAKRIRAHWPEVTIHPLTSCA